MHMCCARQVSCKGICHTLGFLPELVSTYHSAFVTHNESLCIHKRMCKGHLATIPLKSLLCVCAQSYPTLCEPVDSNPRGFTVHGIFQARILECVAISYSKNNAILLFRHTRAKHKLLMHVLFQWQ